MQFGSPSPVEVSGGTVTLGDGSVVELAAGATVTVEGGTIEVSSVPAIELAEGASVVISAGTVNVGGGQLQTSTGISLQPTTEQLSPAQLGTGDDGNATISGTVTLTRDMQYAALTVPSGATLKTNGYRVLCTGTVTIDGTVDNSGTAASYSEGGTCVAGVGGAAGTLPGGADGVVANEGSTEGASAGVAASAATYAGGSSGSATVGSYEGAGVTEPYNPTVWPTLAQLASGTITGGASGGAAADAAAAGSGGGGGCILILCATLAGTGTISANAGDGAGGGTDTWAHGGSGGGIAVVACFTTSFTGTIEANGSAGASENGGSFTNGVNGTATILDGLEW